MVLKSWLMGLVPFGAMVMVESLIVGLTTLSKASMSKGSSPFVLNVYSNALATLILFPSSFIIQRKKRSPPLNFSILCKFFLLGLAGITVMQNCVLIGVRYSSPTLGSAISNLSPAFTFLLAVIFRMEKLNIRSSISQIKIIGTVVSISGALIATLYKGPPIGTKTIQFSGRSYLSISSSSTMLTTGENWIIGALFLTIASLSFAIWNTAQAAVLKSYPSKLTTVSFYSFFGTIQCAVVTLLLERDPSVWILRNHIDLIFVFYAAVFGSVVTFCVVIWCVEKKGPVFIATFKPLEIAIAAFFGAIFLGEILHFGSVIGAVIIILGFYGVIWARLQEEKGETNGVTRLQSSENKAPLLETNILV